MKDKDFETIWRSSSGTELVNIEQQSFLRDLSSKIEKLDKTIEKRNVRENVIGVLMILVFCFVAYIIPYTLTKIASLLIIPYYLFYMYKIRRVHRHKNNDFSQPPKQFLISQKEYLLKEQRLLDTILYWAILPLCLILILFYAGFPMDLGAYLWAGGFTLVVLLAVYSANKYVAKHTFTPILRGLDKMIREFDKERQEPGQED